MYIYIYIYIDTYVFGWSNQDDFIYEFLIINMND